ncbi:MAG: CHRD domain-containing protein [Candidatus Eisenbacteria bacterium]|uniref:CHRD domain-containing protein n=1 Tax=Eiseniibacteriota bacterium TaxID=2212470 RepID=A0A933SEP7_UNCEI|nr:CHRD domain-containing protein [Candidatus Eisenbacteria bacterium]
MRRSIALLLFVLACSVAPAFAGIVFEAHLTGAQSVPPNSSLASADGVFTLNDAGTQLSWVITFQGLEAPLISAHLHRVPTGTGVPLTIGLNPPLGLTSGSWSGVANVSPTTVAEMQAGMFYANIHSEAYVDGEIRGTLVVSTTTGARRGTWGRIKALYRSQGPGGR